MEANLFGSAVILAGGRSSRMGFDKQFLTIGQTRLLDKNIKELGKIFKEVIVVTNKPEEYDSSYLVTSDIIKGMGPLSGIHAGLTRAGSKYVYFMACDMPELNLDYIRYMINILRDEPRLEGVITRLGDFTEPFNSFYSKDLISRIEKNLKEENRSLNRLIGQSNFHYIEEDLARTYSKDWSMFSNINTVSDLEEYKNKED